MVGEVGCVGWWKGVVCVVVVVVCLEVMVGVGFVYRWVVGGGGGW